MFDGTAAADAVRLALVVGGVTLFAAGLLEFRGGNGFTGTAFASLGAFWFTWSARSGAATSKEAAGLFMLLLALLALSLTTAAWQMGGVAQAVFGLLAVAMALSGVAALASSGGLGEGRRLGRPSRPAPSPGTAAPRCSPTATWGRRALADGWRLPLPHRGQAA